MSAFEKLWDRVELARINLCGLPSLRRLCKCAVELGAITPGQAAGIVAVAKAMDVEDGYRELQGYLETGFAAKISGAGSFLSPASDNKAPAA